uniref:hypothetical protein n=2 Tax=Psychrobacter phenylpyruvicus TaxID=29432 RepID=UPI000B32065C
MSDNVFLWFAGLIVIGLPVLAMLMLYLSIKAVKESVETTNSLKDEVAKLKYDYAKLEKLKDDVDMELYHALQQKDFAEEKLEELGYKHIEVINYIHAGILRRLYTRDEMGDLGMLLKNYGKDPSSFSHEDIHEII